MVLGSERRAARRRTGTALVGLVAVASFVDAAPALAQSTEEATRACVAAHVSAQRLRRDRRLSEAKQALVECSRPACPNVIVEECGAWLGEVDRALPSVVFEARGPAGEDVVDVTVSVDGHPLTKRLDGKAIEIDPGEHLFKFESEGGRAPDQTIVIREGDKGRRIQVRVVGAGPSPAVQPATTATRPVPGLAIGLGAVGVVGLGVFAAFGALGLSEKSKLDGLACKPNCDASSARRSFLIGDIALGVGVAALGVGLGVYLARPTVNEPARAQRTVRFATALRPGGAWATLEVTQ